MPTKKRSPKSARTEATMRNQDVTRRATRALAVRIDRHDFKIGVLLDHTADVTKRLQRVEAYLFGAGSRKKK